MLDRSFDLPVGDPRYGDNQLIPGSFPLEHSFSELAGESLRVDFEPLGPGAPAHARQLEAGREMRRIVRECYGSDALRWFDERSESWRGSRTAQNARFGAWFGMGLDQRGVQEAKVYYEMGVQELGSVSPNLRHAARVAMSLLPGLTPIFTSIACGRRHGAQRLYFYHRGDLRLLDLEPVLHALGIGGRLPGLLSALGVVLGGRFVLPEGSVILGLRDTHRGMEAKLDVLVSAFPDPPRQMYDLIRMALSERPRAQRSMHRVMTALTPDESDSPGAISVVSFRVRPDLRGSRISVYLKPTGYTHIGRQTRAPGAALDPYATQSLAAGQYRVRQ